MMENAEFIDSIKSVLIKMENAINLLRGDKTKHIPAYHKLLGVQQKLEIMSEQTNVFSRN